MKKHIAMAGAVYLILSILIILVGRGSLASGVLGLGLTGLGLLAFLICAIGLTDARIRRRRESIQFGAKCMAFSLLLVGMIVPVLLSGALGDADVREAERFCESLVPTLDMIKASKGAYPESLANVVGQRALPQLLRHQSFYRSTGSGFCFTFGYRGSLLPSGWEFASGNRKWEHWD